MKTSKLFTSVLVLSSLAAVACGSNNSAGGDDSISPNNNNDNNNVTPGNGNAAPDASVPANCDPTAFPAVDACVVTEALGVFVAPPSADGGISDGGTASEDGTRGHPYSKMQTAIDTAKTQKKRVYACIGNYSEQITLADGVSIFGDLDCNQNWSVSTKHATIQASASPAARADSIASATRVDSLDLVAPDATAAGGTSVALVVTSSSASLVFANSTIHAGKAMAGANGIEGAQLSNGAGVNGASGVASYPLTVGAVMCSTIPATTNACVGAAVTTAERAAPAGGEGIGSSAHRRVVLRRSIFTRAHRTKPASQAVRASARTLTEVTSREAQPPRKADTSRVAAPIPATARRPQERQALQEPMAPAQPPSFSMRPDRSQRPMARPVRTAPLVKAAVAEWESRRNRLALRTEPISSGRPARAAARVVVRASLEPRVAEAAVASPS